MKTIGLLGGLTFNSTIEYYKRINQKVNHKLGAGNNAQIILNSINYQEIKNFNYQDWNAVADILFRELTKLDSFGVDGILMCNNTLHKSYDLIADKLNLSVPYFHIVDAVGEYAVDNKLKKLLLLGTKFTMVDGFYRNKLAKDFDLSIVIPNSQDVDEVNRMIQEELTFGIVKENSKNRLKEIVKNYTCDGVILGCTELPLLLKADDCEIPLIDTVEVHSNKAVEFILS